MTKHGACDAEIARLRGALEAVGTRLDQDAHDHYTHATDDELWSPLMDDLWEIVRPALAAAGPAPDLLTHEEAWSKKYKEELDALMAGVQALVERFAERAPEKSDDEPPYELGVRDAFGLAAHELETLLLIPAQPASGGE